MTLPRAVYLYVLQHKMMRRIRGANDVLCIHYESLKRDTAGEVARLCDALGVEFQQEMLDVPYAKNTSFPRSQAKKAS